ncbi:hypothetical protein AVEN_217387-1 [Araneus ventricosus]|uniref:Uncharacterized protein n=1 Tax=Araneus ventricosus TaxID=182803 RepID=A0A4Y2HZH4_ARAVE|nr:hypothetical protein AVEN_217387-1 [Araneus ventricosus]
MATRGRITVYYICKFFRRDAVNLNIHDHSAPRKLRGGSSHHSIFQPIHLVRSFSGRSMQCKSICYSHSDSLLRLLLVPYLKNAKILNHFNGHIEEDPINAQRLFDAAGKTTT